MFNRVVLSARGIQKELGMGIWIGIKIEIGAEEGSSDTTGRGERVRESESERE